MKWLLTLFMIVATSMSLISCSKKDDSAPSTPSCYSGNYQQYGNQWVDPRTGQPVNCTTNRGGNQVCIWDNWNQRDYPTQSCGGNGYQMMGVNPTTGQCMPAYPCPF